jgi:hypothetical protein
MIVSRECYHLSVQQTNPSVFELEYSGDSAADTSHVLPHLYWCKVF